MHRPNSKRPVTAIKRDDVEQGFMETGADARALLRLPPAKALAAASVNVWGMVPKLTRMPWDDKEGSPVYLDIRRWLPMGDTFDVDQNYAALPILPGLMPGGPLVTAGEVVPNRSSFTGQPIKLDTDTPGQVTAKLLDFAYKTVMPNILGLPGTTPRATWAMPSGGARTCSGASSWWHPPSG